MVRNNSKFWNVSGAEIEAGLLGVDVRSNPLKAVFEGGIAFATPDPPGQPVEGGAVFALQDKAKGDWQRWAPAIRLPPAAQQGEEHHE